MRSNKWESIAYNKDYYNKHRHPCLVCGVLVFPMASYCREHSPKNPKRTCPVLKLHYCNCGCGKLIKVGEYAAGHNSKSKYPFTELHWCKCGCGVLVEGKYVAGHNLKQNKGKSYEEIHGKVKAVELKKFIAQSSKERYENNPAVRDVLAEGRIKGRLFQVDAIKKLWQKPEFRKHMAESHKAFLESEEGQKYRFNVSWKLSVIKKKEWAEPSHIYNTQAYRDKLSRGTIKQWERDSYVLNRMKANGKKPNRQEMRLSYLLRHTCPHMFKYNGDARLGLVFGGKTPDFVNVNGKKQIIELLGVWWHGEKKSGRTKQEEENRLYYHYRKFGFRCLPIWENELDDKNKLKMKIADFVYA